MKTITAAQRLLLTRLEAEVRRNGIGHHLDAARRLAAAGKPPGTIDFMMRGLFTKAAITALIAEARVSNVITTSTRVSDTSRLRASNRTKK